jgi:hypothetical protein
LLEPAPEVFATDPVSPNARAFSAAKLQPLLDDADAQRAFAILKRDFSEPDEVGPMHVAAFIAGAKDYELQADVVGSIGQLTTKVRLS